MCQPRILGSTQDEAAVPAAPAGEGVVASAELAGDLLIGGAAAAHQHHVEPRQAQDGDEEQGNDSHHHHTVRGRKR